GERRNIKPKSSYWVAARPGQKVVASDSVREFYSSSAYRGPQGRVKLAPSFGRFGGPTRYLHSLRKGRHHPMQTRSVGFGAFLPSQSVAMRQLGPVQWGSGAV